MIKPNRTIQVFGTVDGCYTALTGDAGRPRPTGRSDFCRKPVRSSPPPLGQLAETSEQQPRQPCRSSPTWPRASPSSAGCFAVAICRPPLTAQRLKLESIQY